MPQFFERRDRWGNGLALWVLAALAFVVPLSLWAILGIRMDNSVDEWIGHDNPQALAYRWYRQHFPHDEVVLLSWEGSHLKDPRVSAFAEAIKGKPDADGISRGGLKQVTRLHTPHDLIAQMMANKVPEAEAVQRLQGILLGMGTIKVRLTSAGRNEKQGTIERLQLAAQSRLGKSLEIRDAEPVPEGAVATHLAHLDDQSAVKMAGSEEEAAAASEPEAINTAHDLQVGWPGMLWNPQEVRAFRELTQALRSNANSEKPEGEPLVEECFLIPGSPLIIAMVLSESGLADRAETLRLIRQRGVAVGVPEQAMHLAGGPVAGSALNMEMLKAVWNKNAPFYALHESSIVLLSWLVGMVLAIWMLRSLRLVVMVLGVSYLCVLYSVALVPVTGGSMNMVLVVMPTLLLVTTLSGAIHLANYWKHTASINPRTAVVEAVKAAKMPCIWASLTTAIGLASLMTSALAPIRDFGIYSAVGTVVSLGLILLGLPALLQIFPPTVAVSSDLESADWHHFGNWIARHHKKIIVGFLALGIGMTTGLKFFRSETKVIRYFADRTRVVQDYNFLEANLAGVAPVELIIRFDQDAQEELRFVERAAVVRKIGSEVSKLPDISGTLSLASFLPTVPPLDPKATAPQRAKYSAKSRTIEERIRTRAGKTGSLYQMATDATQFNAPGDELWRITAQVAIMSQKQYGELTVELDEICRNILRELTIHGSGKYRSNTETVQFHPGVSHQVTGMVPLFLATQQELLHSLINSFFMAFATIALVMMLLLRNFWAGLLAMVPNVLPIGMVFGAIAWAGIAVDIGTIVTASIALGIAVDGTLHLVSWFRMGLAQGKSREEAVANALGHCGPAMWQTSFIISLGMIVLYPCDLILISRFGWLMAALVTTALAMDLILTPALLTGPLGWLLGRTTVQEDAVLADMVLEHEEEPADALPAVAAIVPAETSVLPRPHLESVAVMRVRRVE